jgi:hypothetical protein
VNADGTGFAVLKHIATIPGALSPHTDSITGPQRFYRLIGN